MPLQSGEGLPSGRIILAREAPFRLGALRVTPLALEIARADRVVALEPRCMEVLVALAREVGKPVSREQLIDLCWSGRTVSEGALNRCIGLVRKALVLDDRVEIQTIAKIGYRLRVSAGAPAPKAADPGIWAKTPRRRRDPIMAATAFVAGVVATLALTQGEGSEPAVGDLALTPAALAPARLAPASMEPASTAPPPDADRVPTTVPCAGAARLQTAFTL